MRKRENYAIKLLLITKMLCFFRPFTSHSVWVSQINGSISLQFPLTVTFYVIAIDLLIIFHFDRKQQIKKKEEKKMFSPFVHCWAVYSHAETEYQ